MAEPTQKWFGVSGRGYIFTVSEIPCSIEIEGRNGNYVFCRHAADSWIPVLIGEGELQSALETLQKSGCVLEKAATHVHWRFTGGGEAIRKDIEADLIGGNPKCLAPLGCNEPN